MGSWIKPNLKFPIQFVSTFNKSTALNNYEEKHFESADQAHHVGKQSSVQDSQEQDGNIWQSDIVWLTSY